MTEKTLELKIKECIINRLNLDVDPAEIGDDAPIFSAAASGTPFEGKSLELDSVDALEIVVALNNEYNVEITDNDMMIFQSVKTIADFIRERTGVE